MVAGDDVGLGTRWDALRGSRGHVSFRHRACHARSRSSKFDRPVGEKDSLMIVTESLVSSWFQIRTEALVVKAIYAS